MNPVELISKDDLGVLVQKRDDALERRHLAIDLQEEARQIMQSVHMVAHPSCTKGRKEKARVEIDKDMWRRLFDATKVYGLMDSKRRRQMDQQLTAPPEFTMANVMATYLQLSADAGKIFTDSIVTLYEGRNFQFKTNTVNRFNHTFILEYAYQHGGIGWTSRESLFDLDKVVHLIQGKIPPKWEASPLLAAILKQDRLCEERYELEVGCFRLKKYKKGSLHVRIMDEGVLEQMNLILAEHFGRAIGGKRYHES